MTGTAIAAMISLVAAATFVAVMGMVVANVPWPWSQRSIDGGPRVRVTHGIHELLHAHVATQGWGHQVREQPMVLPVFAAHEPLRPEPVVAPAIASRAIQLYTIKLNLLHSNCMVRTTSKTGTSGQRYGIAPAIASNAVDCLPVLSQRGQGQVAVGPEALPCIGAYARVQLALVSKETPVNVQ